MKETLYDRRLLDVIAIIFANRESGRLKIQAGATVGFFSFKEGKLADAHMGALTGFPAINAALSIREAQFSFDPSIPPSTSSFNTPNERIVLKQLFGIETAEPEAADSQVSANVSELPSTHSREMPLSNARDPEWAALEPEVTLVTSKRPGPTLRRLKSYPLLPSLPSLYRKGLYVGILFALLGAATGILLSKLNDRPSPISAAKPSVSAAKPSEPSLPLITQAGKQIEQKSSGPQDLSGRWNVVNMVEKTSYRSFTNLKIAFRLQIKQNGPNFTAVGEKLSENGRMLPATGRTPIRLTGSINGDRVEATFIEQGMRRKTSGRFVWRIEKAGTGLTGTFDSTAANSSGKSAATKEL